MANNKNYLKLFNNVCFPHSLSSCQNTVKYKCEKSKKPANNPQVN